MARRTLIFLLWLLTLVACNLSWAQEVPKPAVVSPVPIVRIAQQTTPIPTVSRDLHPITTPTAMPIVVEQTEQAPQPPAPSAIQYLVRAEIDYPTRRAYVEQTITYRNNTGQDLTSLVLNVEANNWVNGFLLEAISIGEFTPQYTLSANRLEIQLEQSFLPENVLSLKLVFQVQPQRITGGVFASRGFFGYTDRQMNLGHWLPIVAPFIAGEWVVHTPIFVGEQVILPQADWDVLLSVRGAPPNLQLAAPGHVEAQGSARWHIRHPRGRDLTLSLSDAFTMTSKVSDKGVLVEIYTLPDAPTSNTVHSAEHALLMATRAVDMFSDLFGDMPYRRLVVVQGDFPDGMEFSGLIFVGGAWFRAFDGQPNSWLTLITVHEVAHQWWYAKVGSDSALHPWLDEALATYCEYIYIEEYYPVLKEWWWSFRVDSYFPQGAVDSAVYDFASPREYINAVYLRGVAMLHQLRQDLGTEAFFNWLRDYATLADGQLATPQFFWSLLTPQQYAATERTRQLFLRNP